MPDRKKVIDHLQIMHTWASFALEKDINFFNDKHMEHIKEWTDDTLKLLDEQETEIRQLKLALQILKGKGIIVRDT